MFEIKTPIEDGKVYHFSIPTTLSEVTEDYLKAVTVNVIPEKYWAVVAVICRTDLATLCNDNKKNGTVSATYKLVKKNDPDNVISAKDGSILLCEGTSVMRGLEIAAPDNVLAPSKIIEYVKAHNEAVRRSEDKINFANGRYYKTVMFVTFKLIPLSEIHGWYAETPFAGSDYDVDKANSEIKKYLNVENNEDSSTGE